MAQSQPADARPVSPHVSIWRWHVTMLSSILHRATGAALYGGAILIVAWLVAAASGPDAYHQVELVIFSLPGQILLFGFTIAVLFHFANGIRHLIWDGPRTGFSIKTANMISWFNIIFSIIGAAAIWSIASFTGGA